MVSPRWTLGLPDPCQRAALLGAGPPSLAARGARVLAHPCLSPPLPMAFAAVHTARANRHVCGRALILSL